MLLMGMKISFTKKPTKPITTNPMAVRNATLVNSTEPINYKHIRNFQYYKIQSRKKEVGFCLELLPLRSGLWQRLTRRMLSLENSLRGSNTESMASIFLSISFGLQNEAISKLETGVSEAYYKYIYYREPKANTVAD
jgi:hypothetical protein